MARPCTCDGERCGLCRLYRESPRHRDAWGRTPTPDSPAAPAKRPDCRHLGEVIPAGAAARLGLPVLRQWRPCDLGHGMSGHVCGCLAGATCAGCPDYAPGEG